jgi:hypothetical protein
MAVIFFELSTDSTDGSMETLNRLANRIERLTYNSTNKHRYFVYYGTDKFVGIRLHVLLDEGEKFITVGDYCKTDDKIEIIKEKKKKKHFFGYF